jgi:hypothetical protein
MCQATVESNLKGGGTAAAGLNKGIMYLLQLPYARSWWSWFALVCSYRH